MMKTVLKATLITALITGPVLAADGTGKVNFQTCISPQQQMVCSKLKAREQTCQVGL